uniref:Uncharacterized protein n=1 Tax=Anopheles darlingi TaxID=43151 RepID=A0A903WR17_ANODA
MALDHSCQTRSSSPCGSGGQTVPRCLPQQHASSSEHRQHHHHHLRKHRSQQPSTTLKVMNAQPPMATVAATLNTTAAHLGPRNHRPPATSRRRWWWGTRCAMLPFALLLLLLLVLVRPGVTVPVVTDTGVTTGGRMLEDFLNASSDDWLSPCRPANSTPFPTEEALHGQAARDNGTSIHLRKIVVPMIETIQLALGTISQYEDELNRTGWSNEAYQRQYSFLRPFVANVSTWERRLSVYWAFLAFIVNVYETQSNVVGMKPAMLEDMRILRNYIKDILCQVREYRNVDDFESPPIKAPRMSKLIQFNEDDLNKVEVARWFILCRLNCYLNSTHCHLKLVNKTASANPKEKMNEKWLPSCKLCPYLAKGPGAGANPNPHDQVKNKQQPRSKANKKGRNGLGKKVTNHPAGIRPNGDKRGKKQQQCATERVAGAVAAKTSKTANQSFKGKSNRKRKDHRQGAAQQQQQRRTGGKRSNRLQD